MSKTVLIQSIPKPNETVSEDRFRVEENLLAVADGAGGTGIFAGEWAAYLLENLPDAPFVTPKDVDTWLEGIWEVFYNQYESQCANGDIRSKFLEEGSFATLATVWLSKAKSGYQAHYRIFGDSVVLLFHPQNGLEFCSHPDLRIFAESPDLLNWKEAPRLDALMLGNFPIATNSILLLCSDALEQYLLLTHALYREKTHGEAGQLPQLRAMPVRLSALLESLENAKYGDKDWLKEVLFPLQQASKSEKDFKTYLYDLVQKGHLATDDYTLVAATFNKKTKKS
jgi:hypothetical protein